MANDADGYVDTFPKQLLRHAQIFVDRPAIRHKDLGIWQVWTWRQVLDEVCAFPIGLQTLGLRSGDKLAIIGYNRPGLYWAMAATQALSAIPVPLYADSVAEEMAYVIEHCEATAAVAQP